MTSHWYALHCKPRKEEAVWRQVHVRGFESFYPHLQVPSVNPRARGIQPYFPRYLFVHADLGLVGLSAFQYLPHSIGLVSFGGEPAAVPEQLIRALQRRMAELAKAGATLFDDLRSGDRVSVREGPFAGYQGVFDTRMSGRDRVRILLQMLAGRSVPVILNAAYIEPIKRLQSRPGKA